MRAPARPPSNPTAARHSASGYPGPSRSREHLDRIYSRALRWALGISVVFHLLLFVVAPRFEADSLADDDSATSVREPVGLRMLDPGALVLVEPVDEVPPLTEPVPSSDPTTEATITPQPQAWSRPAPVQTAPGDAAADAGGARDAATGNPFRRSAIDPRLQVSEREVPKPTDHERYMDHLEGRLRAYNDSIGATADAERRARDWTVTDKDGRRWGLSPSGRHLGGVTVPVPAPTTTTAEQQQRNAEEARRRREIQGQGEAYDRDRAREESIRRTRERRDAERNGGGG
jgi:hypothetical protein